MDASLVKSIKAAQKKAQPIVSTAPLPVTTVFDPASWETLVAKITETYPDLALDAAAIEKGGVGRNGLPVKLAVFKAVANKAEGKMARNVTLYSSGKAVWTNLAAC